MVRGVYLYQHERKLHLFQFTKHIFAFEKAAMQRLGPLFMWTYFKRFRACTTTNGRALNAKIQTDINQVLSLSDDQPVDDGETS